MQIQQKGQSETKGDYLSRMRRVLWLVGVLAVLFVMAVAQDISRSSPLFFPDGESPFVHPYTSTPKSDDRNTTEDEEWRLPREVVPIRYNLTIHIDPNKDTFSGNVQIYFYCLNATRNLTLHALDLDLPRDFPKVYDVYDETQSFEGISYLDYEHQTLTYKLDRELQHGHSYYVDINFRGMYTANEFLGLYRSYYTQNGEKKVLAVTQFQPTHARRMFPCFDEPNKKAYFNVTVIHPQEFIALSNSPLKSKQVIVREQLNQTISSFEETVKMPTYLLAIVVSEYQNFSKENDLANIWARPDIIAGANFSQGLAADYLCRLERYTNISFVMRKIDHVAVPHFKAGAMENYGLITYKEPYLSLEENTTKTPIKVYTVTVIAHELAHQWFGNLVTLDWWSYTWLNEAFATFVAYHLPGEDMSWRLREQFIPAKLQAGMEADQDPATSTPMSSPVEKPEEISSKFDPISYSKGGAVLRMFESLLGETLFQEAIRNYLIKRAATNAAPQDLFQEFEKVTNKSTNPLPAKVDWTGVGESWTAQPGLPLVTVTRNYINGEVTLTQKRFCSGESADRCKQGQWWIPLTWTFQGEKDPEKHNVIWLHGDSKTESVSFKPEVGKDRWILFNLKSNGYYRVNYDSSNWKLLADDLIKNPSNIPTENRAQILHDVLHFASADETFVSQAMNITQFLQNEQDVVVWMTGVKVLRSLYYVLGPTAAYDAFEGYSQKLLAKIYAKQRMTREQNTAEEVEKALIRAYVTPYACMFGVMDCLKDAGLLIEKILNGSGVHPDVETAVSCGGVRAGDEKLFWRVREKALESNNAPINDVLLAALSCSKDKNLIKEHLHSVVTDKSFPKNKTVAALELVIKSVRTFHVVYVFIHDNFKTILDLIGGDDMTYLLRVLCTEVRTGNQYQNVQTMIETNKYNIKDVESLEKVLKSRSYIVDRNKRLARSVANWLAQESGNPVSPDEPGPDGDHDANRSATVQPTIAII